MIQINAIDYMIGSRELFTGASAMISPGDKVGLVGRNGCGKSTLLSLLVGRVSPDKGEITLPPDWVTATVAQETPALQISALEHVIQGDLRYQEICHLLKEAEERNDGAAIGRLHAEMDIADGYTIRSRAAEILAGLGFAEDDSSRPVADFSGGWRMRLNLARALIVRSDLLLLDEPTNHLDLDAVIFLENFLRNYRGTLVLISHDRDFLDRTVSRILHIEDRKLNEYTGNYSRFETMRLAKMELQQAQREKQQAAIRHMKAFVDRFRYKATKARQAQSRLKALEKMDTIAAVHTDSPFTFRFREPDTLPNPLITMDNLTLGYGDHKVLTRIRLDLTAGSRIGLLGHNGAGKSTLVKCLAGELEPLDGTIHRSAGLKIGYFAQEQLEHLRLEESALKHMQLLSPGTREQDLRTYLGSFAFSGSKADDRVATFSGGEKARLALALIVWQKPNLLLLDEPTNHLDLGMRDALTLALQDYSGALVVVSHDRHLLKSVTDEFYLADQDRVREFPGDLEDYQRLLLEQQKAEPKKAHSTPPTSTAQKGQGDTQAGPLPVTRPLTRNEQRQRHSQFLSATRELRKEIDRLTASLASLEQQEQEIDTALEDNSLYDEDSREQLNTLLQKRGKISRKKEEAEERWLELSEELEQRRQELDTPAEEK